MLASGRLASYLMKYPRDSKGNLPYRLKDGNHIYADTIGMICPFSLPVRDNDEDDAAVKLGVAQMVHFLETEWMNGQDFLIMALTAIRG